MICSKNGDLEDLFIVSGPSLIERCPQVINSSVFLDVLVGVPSGLLKERRRQPSRKEGERRRVLEGECRHKLSTSSHRRVHCSCNQPAVAEGLWRGNTKDTCRNAKGF